jgi:hypothetical protein
MIHATDQRLGCPRAGEEMSGACLEQGRDIIYIYIYIHIYTIVLIICMIYNTYIICLYIFYLPYFPAHKTHFFPEKCDLNLTCVLCAESKCYFQTYK